MTKSNESNISNATLKYVQRNTPKSRGPRKLTDLTLSSVPFRPDPVVKSKCMTRNMVQKLFNAVTPLLASHISISFMRAFDLHLDLDFDRENPQK